MLQTQKKVIILKVLRGIRLLIISLLSIFHLSCFGPFVRVIDVDEAAAEKLKSEVKIYDSSELKNVKYERIDSIDATSCMNKLWDPPASEENAISQLRYRAVSLGGNGITNLLCGKEAGTSLRTNCWNSITCRGVAIKIVPE